MKLAIVCSQFYPLICTQLRKSCLEFLEGRGYQYDSYDVDGSFEIPGCIAFLEKERTGLYKAYIALGCVIRGETSHYDYVCAESARGIMELNLSGLAVVNGILTVENEQQAWDRVYQKDKGRSFASTAVNLVEFRESIKK